MKVALVHNDDFSLWIFRRGLIERLMKMGYQVVCISTPGEYVGHLESLGATHIPVEIARFISPIKDIKLLKELYMVFRKEKFDIVHNFTIKPNTYGTLAASLAGTKNIVISVTGLGFAFSEVPGIKIKIVQFVAQKLYRLAFNLSTKIWFQNNEEKLWCIANGMIEENKTVLINSSGVNLKTFSPPAVDKIRLHNLKRELGASSNKRFTTLG